MSSALFEGMMDNSTIADRISTGDVSLFDAIATETTGADRRNLLAVQSIIAEKSGTYRYLEIGSHRGGSLQPHVLDSRCAAIYSVDPRPSAQSDERGGTYYYHENSTQTMMDNLRTLCPEQSAKVQTFEMSMPDLTKSKSEIPPVDLIFIDGEHTDSAAQADFEAALHFAAPDAIIIFHDAPIVYAGISKAVTDYNRKTPSFIAMPLPDSLFIVALDREAWLTRQRFTALFQQSGDAYLTALILNQGFRSFHRLLPFRLMRSILHRIGLRKTASAYSYGVDQRGQ